jgi:hypothetical protein
LRTLDSRKIFVFEGVLCRRPSTSRRPPISTTPATSKGRIGVIRRESPPLMDTLGRVSACSGREGDSIVTLFLEECTREHFFVYADTP